jgi:nucleoside-diphosphate kinase
MISRTLVLIKPDGVRRGISGEIISRFEKVGLKIIAMKLIRIDAHFAKQHYTYDDIAVRHGEETWKRLLAFISASPVIAIVLEGDKACMVVRKMIGDTEPLTASSGTIRGDYAHHSYSLSSENNASIHNLVHASSSEIEASAEIRVWFNDDEIYHYKRNDDNEHIYE